MRSRRSARRPSSIDDGAGRSPAAWCGGRPWALSCVTVINWNGADLPDELRQLPAQRADDAPTAEEEDGLTAALESVRAGKGVPHADARERLLSRARR